MKLAKLNLTVDREACNCQNVKSWLNCEQYRDLYCQSYGPWASQFQKKK